MICMDCVYPPSVRAWQGVGLDTKKKTESHCVHRNSTTRPAQLQPCEGPVIWTAAGTFTKPRQQHRGSTCTVVHVRDSQGILSIITLYSDPLTVMMPPNRSRAGGNDSRCWLEPEHANKPFYVDIFCERKHVSTFRRRDSSAIGTLTQAPLLRLHGGSSTIGSDAHTIDHILWRAISMHSKACTTDGNGENERRVNTSRLHSRKTEHRAYPQPDCRKRRATTGRYTPRGKLLSTAPAVSKTQAKPYQRMAAWSQDLTTHLRQELLLRRERFLFLRLGGH
ncbi:unnamed protein product, partial [Ectocarpus sp. 8 AP-2014]